MLYCQSKLKYMRKVFTIIIITAFSLPAFAQQKIFIQVTNIKGESQDANHKDWIDASAFSGGGSNIVSLSGSGVATGKTSTQDFLFTICLDKSVNLLRNSMYKGQVISSVIVEFVVPNGGNTTVVSKIEMQQVYVTSISEGGTTADNKNLVNISFVPTRFRHTYYPIDPTTGVVGTPIIFGWDILKNIPW